MARTDDLAPRQFSRLRTALIAMLVLLTGLLAVIVVFVAKLLAPVAPAQTVKPAEGITWVRSIYGSSAAAVDQLDSPAHVAVGPDGTIWVTDLTRSRVLGFNPDGSFNRELAAGGANEGMLQAPSGIAASPEGEVFVASAATGLIIVWDADGVISRVIDTVEQPFQVALSGDKLFVTAADGLHLLTTAGDEVAAWSSRGTGPDQVDLPQGAAVGADGTLYICDTHNAQIKAFSADGADIKWANPESSKRQGADTAAEGAEVAVATEAHPSTSTVSAESSTTASQTLAATLQIPAGLAIDGAGRLVFVDPFSYAVYTADATSGEILAKYGEAGQSEGMFNYPTGIAYDPVRDWFAIADTANKRVQIVRITGSGGAPTAALRRLDLPWGALAVPVVLLGIALVVARARARRPRGGT